MMSRGNGWQQRCVLRLVFVADKPLTFKEIGGALLDANNAPPNVWLKPSVERSLRRAIQVLVRNQDLLIPDKHSGGVNRYGLNPLMFVLAGENAKFEHWCDVMLKPVDEPAINREPVN
jgi:hypothetical protein